MRNHSIDSLKFICAILIVLLHTTTPYSQIYLPLTRCAVPVFFMISGYMLYGDNMDARLRKGIRKVFILILWSSLLFAVFNFAVHKFDTSYLIPSSKQLFNFMAFNENPWGGHLWYLSAYLYVMIILLPCAKHHLWNWSFVVIIPLLCMDLIFGKYSLALLDRQFDYIYVRNFLCVGIPYFLIGVWIKHSKSLSWMNTKIAMGGVILFCLTSMLEYKLLASAGLNATRDHYISSTFLSISLFTMFLRYNQSEPSVFSEIGRKDSLYVYIYHPIWISAVKILGNHIPTNISVILNYTAPFFIIGATFLTIYLLRKIKPII